MSGPHDKSDDRRLNEQHVYIFPKFLLEFFPLLLLNKFLLLLLIVFIHFYAPQI